MEIDAPPLIVTLALDAESFAWLDALRQAHFPPARNFLKAHLTLFHKLPGGEAEAVGAVLRAVAADVEPLPLVFAEPMFLGRGVAVRVESAALHAVRARLAQRWRAWLTAQDRQGFRPHVTIQNKVAPERARALHADLAAGWAPRTGTGPGLVLWRYLGGPWAHVEDVAFGG